MVWEENRIERKDRKTLAKDLLKASLTCLDNEEEKIK